MTTKAWALVTGPTAGIGKAFATALAERGFGIVLVARDGARLAELAAELEARTGQPTEVLVADLADRAQLATVEDRLADTERPIEVLVNNAGFGLRGSFTGSAVEDQQRMVDVLVTAVMRLSHAAAVAMRERGHGSIVNVSSVAGWMPGGPYSAAKSWVTVFSEGLNGELASKGVRVLAVCPGFVHTEFHARAGMDMSGIPEWAWLDADDVVAQAFRDLAAGRSVSVTGVQYKTASTALQYLPRPLVRMVAGGRRKMLSRDRKTP